MEFSILGPLEVRAGGRLLPIGPLKQRNLLAQLLLHANRPVAADELVDSLWGERPPRTAGKNLHVHVYRLRRLLTAHGEEPERLRYRPPGYQLVVAPDELDALRFEALVRSARDAAAHGDPWHAAESYRAALALWRGPVLADLANVPALQAEVARLEEQRTVVVEEDIETGLVTGRHAELTAELKALVAAHPLRERLRGQYMLALYRSGRQAEALSAYDDARRTLAAELGLEPSPLLQRLQRAILASEDTLEVVPHAQVEPGVATPAAFMPWQLPPSIEDFSGRERELAHLHELLGAVRPGTPGSWVVAVIAGQPGVGKTTLAVRAAHEVRAQFPDGQLYMHLRGPDGVALPPRDVLAELLRALQVAGSAIPDRLEERASLYWARLAERRILVVLDDAASEAQVRPLLPSGAGCATIVTSRSRLGGLEAARLVELGTFDAGESLTLLTRILGAERVRAERDAAERIVGYCGHLPLAIRIAGVRLVGRRQWPLAWLAGKLADERGRLDELATGDLAVRASLRLCYQTLDTGLQDGLHLATLNLPDFTPWVAGALLGTAPETAETMLEGLLDAQLLESVGVDATGQPRYRFHDLVRLYAREQAEQVTAPEARAAALRRVLGAYLFLADRAEARLPGGLRGVVGAHSDRWVINETYTETLLRDPLAWFETERPGIVAAVAQGSQAGLVTLACGLACATAAFFELRAHFDWWGRAQRLVLEAARRSGQRPCELHALRSLGDLELEKGHATDATPLIEQALAGVVALGDRRVEAYCLRSLGVARHGQGRLDDAVDCLERSLRLFRQLEDRQGEAYAAFSLGSNHSDRGRLDDAVDCLERSLRLFEQLGDSHGEGYAVRSLGRAYQAQRLLDRAVPCFERSLRLFEQLDDRRGVALARLSLGETLRERGQPGAAEGRYHQSIGEFRAIGDRFGEALVLHALGELRHDQGRLEDAADCFARCLDIFREFGVSLWEARALRRLGDAAHPGGPPDNSTADGPTADGPVSGGSP